jgi:iron-regulated transporter 1
MSGYAYTQGVSESLLGIMTAVGAVFGLLGSVSFPYLRRAFGKLTTGHLGFALETLFLMICLISIFTKGSPFPYWNFYENIEADDALKCQPNLTFKVENETFEVLSLDELWNSNISVLLLMGGIITARFGK